MSRALARRTLPADVQGDSSALNKSTIGPSPSCDPLTANVGQALRPDRRRLLDMSQNGSFAQYPYYTVKEVSAILGISPDGVRTLFREGRQGPVLQICSPKPGKRRYLTLLVPYHTLIRFLHRFTKG
jgi:hypothetical protein